MTLILRSAIIVFALAVAIAVRAQDAPEAIDHSDHMDQPDQTMDAGQVDHSRHMEQSDQMGDSAEMDHSQHVDHPEPTMESGEMDHTQHMESSEDMQGAGETDHSQHMDDSEPTIKSDEMDHSQHMEQSDEMDHSGHAMETDQMDQTGSDAPMEPGGETGELRDPHAYAEGEDFGPLGRPHLHDEKHFGAVLIDRLESVHSDDNSWFAVEGQGWYGSTYDRANLKLELEADSGTVEHARTELLWSHAIASFWDTQLGIRHDSGKAPDRTWAAFGVQGLAPYWFHVDATLYAGHRGDTAARFEAEYDLLFTQRLILQPRLEANLYGQNDDETETGSGLSDLTVGLRLRYEITRQFAPYVGVQWAGLYGGTADYARNDNLPTEETSWVIGVHMWF